ncbi:succinate dehydrogenase assembly factor 2 [Candidatus Legionella polyplacis]|uniref:FAD assembly factor SdhE n=1 Tax=Candidatus Legionella polyplacis TaxID=2005262 RepID=A0ABZ2H010_9GAMM
MVNYILEKRYRKIKWRCRRGILELDLILRKFINNKIFLLSKKQLFFFEMLINYDDQVLFDWFVGRKFPLDKNIQNIIKTININNFVL